MYLLQDTLGPNYGRVTTKKNKEYLMHKNTFIYLFIFQKWRKRLYSWE